MPHMHGRVSFASGQQEYWEVFQDAYRAVMRHYRSGAWYDDADIGNGRSLHQQFQSLQAFWPGPPEPHLCCAVLCCAALRCTVLCGDLPSCAVLCCGSDVISYLTRLYVMNCAELLYCCSAARRLSLLLADTVQNKHGLQLFYPSCCASLLIALCFG